MHKQPHRTAEWEAERMAKIMATLRTTKKRRLTESGQLNRDLFYAECSMHPVGRGHLNITDVVRITVMGGWS